MKSILHSKKQINISSCRENYEKFLKGDSISKRIMDLLEPKFKVVFDLMEGNLEEKTPKKSVFNKIGFHQLFPLQKAKNSKFARSALNEENSSNDHTPKFTKKKDIIMK